jgi:hypothetical protein
MSEVPPAVTVPVLLAALSLVGLVLKWLIQRETDTDSRMVERIAALELEVIGLRERQSEERRLKHDALNRAGGLAMAVRLLLGSARRCSCGELRDVVDLIDRTGVMESRFPGPDTGRMSP